MSSAFDPYYIWLGIPPEEQPPHHYRLLGVTLFEENFEVIEGAVNRPHSSERPSNAWHRLVNTTNGG